MSLTGDTLCGEDEFISTDIVNRLSEGGAPRALHAPARACTAGAASAGVSYGTLPAPKFSFLDSAHSFGKGYGP